MKPYITPQKLMANKQLPIKCDIAIICLIPMPKYFEQYEIKNIPKEQLQERLFVSLHPSHVMYCQYNEISFTVLSEVYGGPVCVSLVEELHYYGIKCIIGLGFVGSLDNSFQIGTIVEAISSLAEPGTTPHYDRSQFVNTDQSMTNLFINDEFAKIVVWTTNAIYREYKEDVDLVKNLGCQVVNMDTSHLFASCKMLGIMYGYFATVSDMVLDESESEWENGLTHSIQDAGSSQKMLIDSILAKLSIIDEKIKCCF